ncbi:T9SS type A sorting domain-containing protein [candidate division WOR-3 bacterium]|uniref:T9SS type A sorting domain-containing protein n=1 Tax=candidate division WOR-3 bacterium TaxID=2052148 RepID=A0A938BUT6_UNCW3|nr:T9SS type A sorting domain-containing protein [candidate division WOR-3 bacterium]
MKQLAILAAAAAIAAGQSYIGRLDTIGGTTYDWWVNANVRRSLINSPQHGVHAAWMYSSSNSGTNFPDRNARYNFYDYTFRQWNWSDPDHMQSGENIFDKRAGYGSIDADPATGVVIVAGHVAGTGGVQVRVASDAAPGAGIFEYSDGPSGEWPDMSIGDDGSCHVGLLSGGGLSYSRFRASGGWDSLRLLDSLAFPTYAIAASETGPSVCATWVGDSGAFFLLSENRGDTWSSRTQLDPPPAFGGDTVTRFSPRGPFPFFDSQGRLHLVAAVYPEVNDTAYVNPAEVWHWCPANQPRWAEIHHAGCLPENMEASIGYDAIYADRPSIGEGDEGDLYVAWEQFDSSNVEPLTDRLRAGVWVANSWNNGASWWPGRMVTERSTSSHRFPCIIDRALPGEPSADTVCVLYLMDQVAGFFVQGEGPATPNPVVCQFIYPPSGAEERPASHVSGHRPAITIVRGVLFLPRDMTEKFAGSDRVPGPVLLDASGRKVLDLHLGANDVSRLAPGVYFVRVESSTGCLTTKLAIAK